MGELNLRKRYGKADYNWHVAIKAKQAKSQHIPGSGGRPTFNDACVHPAELVMPARSKAWGLYDAIKGDKFNHIHFS